jgi:TusA-related sulfurtransferase
MATGELYDPDVTIDARGRTCPEPILEAQRRTSALPRGGILKLVSDCPGTRSDLLAWARQTGKELLAVQTLDANARVFYLRNGDPWPASEMLDMRGRPCPAPVIEAGRRLQRMPAGSTLKLISDCSGFVEELTTWSRRTGHRVLGTVPGPSGSEVSYIQG